jgi:hypothetical protein
VIFDRLQRSGGKIVFRRRTGPTVLILALVGLLSTSVPSAAQPSGLVLPPGHWNGYVYFGGEYTTEGGGLQGTSYKDVRTVKSSVIFFDLVVDRQGQVTEGTMTVEIEWSSVNTGTSPATNAPYRVTGKHRDTGSLDLEGNAEALIATGTVTTNSSVYAGGDFLEEVSGPSNHEVGWVFQASEVNCGMVGGILINAWGTGMMVNAHHGSSEPVAVFQLLSAESEEDRHALLVEIASLNEFAASVLADPSPAIADLVALVVIAEAVRAFAARLEQCQVVPEGFVGSEGEGWLATLLRKILFKALERPEEWEAKDIIQMLNIGVRGGAVATSSGSQAAEELYEEFGDALEFALGRAVASDDTAAITDIAAAAAQYGFTDLYDAATAALEEEDQ